MHISYVVLRSSREHVQTIESYLETIELEYLLYCGRIPVNFSPSMLLDEGSFISYIATKMNFIDT